MLGSFPVAAMIAAGVAASISVGHFSGITLNGIELRANSFEWVKGETPFSSWRWPVAGVLVYGLTLLVLRAVLGGPVAPGGESNETQRIRALKFSVQQSKGGDEVIRTTQRPLSFLNLLLAFHNVLLMLASLAMFIGCALALIEKASFEKGNLFALFCDPERQLIRGATFFWPYVFYLSKYWELLDTVFMVFKRQQLPFLHVYHHCVTLTLAWIGMNNEASLQFVPLLLNTFVHILMYYNYACTALGQYVWWKRYLTQAQMIQFWLNVFGVVTWLVLNKYFADQPTGCAGEVWANWLCLAVQISFFALFRRFYSTRYSAGQISTEITKDDAKRN